MASVPLLIKDDIERLGASTQIDFFGGSSMNQAFTAVAQEVVKLLKQFQPLQPTALNALRRQSTVGQKPS